MTPNRGSVSTAALQLRCAGANSYYFNQHGEAALLRPTSTRNSLKEAGSFPFSDYVFG